MAQSENECTCPVPLEPWRVARPHRDCPVHGNVDERVDRMIEKQRGED